MLHGKGRGNFDPNDQSWMTNTFEDKRLKGLDDRTKLTSEERLKYEISGAAGGGMTNPDTYEIKQFPFPVNQTVRKKKKIDIRKVDPRIGEMSD